jgi:hypothetical protein
MQIFHRIEYKYSWQPCNNCSFVFNSTTAPNKFHRFMQRVFLGFRWEKI